MKLNEFPSADQNLIKLRLDAETEIWRQTYWHREKTSPAAKEMQEWNRRFVEFRDSVLAGGDIEEAFFTWSGQDLIFPDTNKINSPQYGFYGMYVMIKIRFDNAQLQNEI